MSKKVIKILWADDEAVYDDPLKPWDDNDQYQIELLEGVRDAEGLENALIKHDGFIDAVIVDANFAIKGEIEDDRTGTGLHRSNELKAKYGKDGNRIPFFLYTGRDDETLNVMFGSSSGELDYYKQNNHKFSKSDEDSASRLFDRIYEVVSEHNTIEFQLRNLYSKVFEAAKLINAENLLLKGLMYEYNDNWSNVQDYFNPLRKIFEQITDCCVEKEILPFVNSIEGYGHLLNLEPCNGFALKSRIMHETLCRMLEFFLDITQDGSHKKDGMKLQVDKYVRSIQNINLYKSVLYIAMDLLVWYKNTIIDGNLPKRNWTGNYLYEGKIEKKSVKTGYGKELTIYYTGHFQLEPPKEGLTEGLNVIVVSSRPNTKDPVLTDYVHNGNYRVESQ